MLRGEERHCVLWVPPIVDQASSVELGAVPAPACMCVLAACCTVQLVFVMACIGAVFLPAITTYVLLRRALRSEMAPFSAFHALYGLLLLLRWPDFDAADI